MPYKIVKRGEKRCVVKADGPEETMHCYDGADAEEKCKKYVKALYFAENKQAEADESVMLEKSGPVIIGIAATNRPHLPLPPISVIQEGEQEVVRVPFLRAGIYRHPTGDLVFTDKVFSKMLQNHEAGVNHHGVSLDLRHKPELGALAWFDTSRGGRIVQEEDAKFGKLLVAYGRPTTVEAASLLKSAAYVYASVEFSPNYEGVMKQALSADDLVEFTLEQIIEEEGKEMPKKTDEGVLLSEEEVAANAAKLAELEAKIAELQAKLAEFSKPVEPEVPDAVKEQLEKSEARIRELERQSLAYEVEATISKAMNYRDANGNAHSPVLLSTAKALLLGDSIAETVKLEGNTTGDVVTYFRKGIKLLLETLPGQVPMQGNTEPEDKKLEAGGTGKFTEQDFKDFWTDTNLKV